jgi:hypothetical protein
MGYGDPLYNYGQSPSVPLSDFVGAGSFWFGAAVFQFYWLCFATILMVLAYLLWPRGTDLGLRVRIKRMGRHASTAPIALAAVAAVAMAATGVYAYRNTHVINRYQTADDVEKFQADYEKKYLKYEKLPQPSIAHVKLDVQLFPKQRRLIAAGTYDLVNNTKAPITDVHVRQGDQDVTFSRLEVSGARLISDDKKFGYRIYRFDTPLAPGSHASLSFSLEVWHRGFRARGPATDVIENGTFVNNFTFAPIIGMDQNNLLTDRSKRRRQGLPADLRPAKLEDLSATARNYIGSDWTTSDITVSTDADQTPIAPGNRVSDVTSNGRRTAHFVSGAPILNFFSIQSANYKVATRDHNGLQLQVYYHQGHDWNVEKMLNAMGTALDYYRAHFGPYQFNYARIIEFPGYASFAQAFAPVLGAPGHRREHAGRHDDQRDAGAIFGADGDEAPLWAGQDPPLPQVRTRYLPAQQAGRGGGGSAARAGREPALHPLPQGRSGHVPVAGTAGRGCGRSCAVAVPRALPVQGCAL